MIFVCCPLCFQSYLLPLLATVGLTLFLCSAWLATKELFLALYVERGGGGAGGGGGSGGQCGSYDYSRDNVSALYVKEVA